ncbi:MULTISPECIES: hypothetical protein [unclassified Roseofilum]|uniref:hypothetical protein n=1 Tax=unclassified Roseofilum TaxID=2620099 RepID=UPI001B240912|nr:MULTISPECIES: hypothetical protein [unclassified Roseofilum]MBP0009552.1 hypothetical protein [Roseofilum sp. Belize Diploria]MBP0013721.1 hypothetical protein [Roseofilum sp. SID3]MBP0024934.1 hypothetical protein [Roseofilum sp. SID2]MBP0039422.1 hypothetical protein [Roseofilum sp. SID1]MBP0043150.1 hypothetical protein [Roseofilum sp. SBFL]
MKISFDLDDTLICWQLHSRYEPNAVPLLLRLWFNEPLRFGTCNLIRQLKKERHEICVYTTSYRSLIYIRLFFCFYGIHIKEVINQKVHDLYFQKYKIYPYPSKNPKAFGIDLHVDDSEGVQLEAAQYDFKVVIISPLDNNWAKKVLDAVRKFEREFNLVGFGKP